jgi:hypothetical protein
VYAREILREDARTAQLTDAVPDKKARHQQASERRQVSFEIVHGAFSSILLLLLCAACAEPISRTGRLHLADIQPRLRLSANGRYCCKSLFALVIKNSPGCRRDFRVKMWGTSSPDDKLTGDLGSVIETTQIGGRRSDRLMAGKLSPGNFGLLQQYLPGAAITGI